VFRVISVRAYIQCRAIGFKGLGRSLRTKSPHFGEVFFVEGDCPSPIADLRKFATAENRRCMTIKLKFQQILERILQKKSAVL
jgi:hypothetical protein